MKKTLNWMGERGCFVLQTDCFRNGLVNSSNLRFHGNGCALFAVIVEVCLDVNQFASVLVQFIE